MLIAQAEHWLESRRIDTKNTHGTGCTLSAAIAANRAAGASEIDAAQAAKSYITRPLLKLTACRLDTAMGLFTLFYDHFIRSRDTLSLIKMIYI